MSNVDFTVGYPISQAEDGKFVKITDTTLSSYGLTGSSGRYAVLTYMAGAMTGVEIDVNIQDQTTNIIGTYLATTTGSQLILSGNPTPDSYTLVLSTGSIVATGALIGMFADHSNPRDFYATVIGVTGNIIELDTPVDENYLANDTYVSQLVKNMNVDGSTSRKIFYTDNYSSVPYDITQICFSILDTPSGDDLIVDKFGDLNRLSKGVILRKKHVGGTYHNICNVKSNEELTRVAGHFDYVSKTKHSGGSASLHADIYLGGQANFGVVVRLYQGERLEVIVQDDLTGLNDFVCYIKGHYTADETTP